MQCEVLGKMLTSCSKSELMLLIVHSIHVVWICLNGISCGQGFQLGAALQVQCNVLMYTFYLGQVDCSFRFWVYRETCLRQPSVGWS